MVIDPKALVFSGMLSLVIPGNLVAQQTDFAILHFVSAASVDHVLEKNAVAVLQALDPGARLSVQSDRMHLKVGLKAQIESAVVVSALAQAGVVAVLLPAPRSGEGVAKNASGFPVLVHTGDPELDNRTYQAAKAAWVAQNPAAYQQLLDTGADH